MALNIFVHLLGLGQIFGVFKCKAAFEYVLARTCTYVLLLFSDFTKISELLKLPNQVYMQQVRMISSFKALPTHDTTVLNTLHTVEN